MPVVSSNMFITDNRVKFLMLSQRQINRPFQNCKDQLPSCYRIICVDI